MSRLAILIAVPSAIAAMGAVFWQRELRDALPTPRPAGLVQTPRGEALELPVALTSRVPIATDRPVLLHFYNPDCPCSRFNRDHVAALHGRYGDRVQFVEIVEATTADAATNAAASGLAGAPLADVDGSIARACGIYSTPQAVLLSAERRLAFRGNFNVARYCTSPATQFVRQAIEHLLGQTPAAVDDRAVIAYGCPLPQEECRANDR